MIENNLGIAMVLVLPGSFLRGDPQGMAPESSPAYIAHVTTPYYIGKYEFTQAHFESVMGTNPAIHRGGDLPIHFITYEQAVRCAGGVGMRLPTEIEWEYAADGSNHDQSGTAGRAPRPVATGKPNRRGIYNLLGNVAEFVGDVDDGLFRKKLYSPPWARQRRIVIRGGSFLTGNIPAHHRFLFMSNWPDSTVGFRVARNP